MIVLVLFDIPPDDEVNFFRISGAKIVCSTLFLVMRVYVSQISGRANIMKN